tara:strand:+ start:694 stop:1092 length:399 start_codon:yes stop_codon:yes gene_type:complete
MIGKYTPFILVIFLLNANSLSFPIKVVNNLVEENGHFYRKITKQKVTGNFFKDFDGPISFRARVGLITKDGKEGKWTRWWKNGIKKSEGFYEKNKKVGYWVEWNQSGVKYYEILYDEGNIIKIKNYHKQAQY